MRLLKKIDKGLAFFEEHITSISVCIMTIILVYNVFARYVFKVGVGWTEEIGKLCMVFVTYLGLSYVTRIARHINMTILIDRLGEKGQRIFQIIMNLIMAAFFLYLTYSSTNYALTQVMPTGRVTTNLRIPVYLMVMVMSLGFLTTAYRFFYIFILNLVNKDMVWFSSDHPGPVLDEEMEALEAELAAKAAANEQVPAPSEDQNSVEGGSDNGC